MSQEEHKPIRMTIQVGGEVLWSEPWAAGLIYYQKEQNGPWIFNWVGMNKESAKQVLAFLADHEDEFCAVLDDMPYEGFVRY